MPSKNGRSLFRIRGRTAGRLPTHGANITVDTIRQFDGRTGMGRIMKGKYKSYLADCGGEDQVSVKVRDLLEEAIIIKAKLMLMHEKVLSAPCTSVDLLYLSFVRKFLNVMQAIGLHRVPKDLGLLDINPHAAVVSQLEAEEKNKQQEGDQE